MDFFQTGIAFFACQLTQTFFNNRRYAAHGLLDV